MKRSSAKLIASLACFTLGSGSLWGDTIDDYVNTSNPAFTTCTDCSSTGCCSFLDAINAANQLDATVSSSIIHLTVSTISYTTDPSPYCNEEGLITITSDLGGSVLDFGGISSTCGSVFQPTYTSASLPGNITLENVVIQNTLPGSYINLSGGSLTINGTSTSSGQFFENNLWTVSTWNSNQPSLIFGGGTGLDYSVPLEGDINFLSNDTNLTLTSNYAGNFAIKGDILPDPGVTGSVLTVNATAIPLYLTGEVQIPTLNVNSGGVFLAGSSNTIGTINVTTNGQLYITSTGSVSSSSSTINLNNSTNGQLIFGNNFTSDAPLGSNITLNLQSGLPFMDDYGYTVYIASQVTGPGGYLKIGSGVQALTNNTNNYSGGTFVSVGILSISNPAQLGTGNVDLNGGTLYASESLILSNIITVNVDTPSGGLAAALGKTLRVQSLLTGSNTLTIGSAGSSLTGLGTVTLENTSNSFSGPIVVGAVNNSTNYPAILSVAAATPLGTPTSMTLQAGSTLASTASLSLGSIPIYLGPGGANLSPSASTTLTIPGNISTLEGVAGSQAPIIINTGGTVIFQGDNSASNGSLLIFDGTVQVGSMSNLGSNGTQQVGLYNGNLIITGDLTTQRTLVFGGTTSISVTGSAVAAFTGSVAWDTFDSLTKIGTGTLSILPTSAVSLPSDYVLSIGVSAGTLIGNTFFFRDNAITVAASSNVEFYQTTDGTFDGTISGAGYVSITGSSPLTFAPTSSTYTGGTHVSGSLILDSDVLGNSSATLMGEGGTIRTLSSFSMSRPITLTGNTTFSPDQYTILQLTGPIAGFGSLTKSGLGALVLKGNSTYSGKTYVNEGALIVTGNIVASVDPLVAAGAILSGTGSVGDTDVYGTIKGGNPLGTLTVTGDLILREGSNFGTLVTGGNNSLVAVSGTVTIESDSNYYLGVLPGFYQTGSIVLLSGSSITGEFTTVNTLSAAANFVSSELVYTGTQVVLDVTARSFDSIVEGQNAKNVAGALEDVITQNRTITYTVEPGSITASSPPELVDVLVSLLPLTTETEMTNALNQLHPAQLKGMAISQENNVVQVRESLSMRLQNEMNLTNCFLADNFDAKEKKCCEKNQKIMTAWLSGIGESFGQDSKNNYWGPLAGYRVNTGGFTTGIDGKFAEHFYAGALGGYTHSHLHWKSGKGSGDISSGYAGLYLSALNLGKMFYGNASVIGSWSEYSADRRIKYGSVNLVAKNSHGGSQILTHIDSGLNLNYQGLTVRPFDSFDYISQVEDGYREQNAGQWELAVNKMNAIMLRNELGVQLAKCYCMWKSKWVVSPKLSWVKEIRVKGDDFAVKFAEAAPYFLTEGYFPDRNLFAPGLAITGLMLQDALAFDLYYNGEFTSGYSNNNYGGQVSYSF